MSIIHVEGLKVQYRVSSRNVVVRAVDGVDIEVERGTTYGLVGESGCGKSTFGRALLRLIEPVAGSIRIDGVDILGLKSRELRAMRRRMQMVFQDPLSSLNPRQTIESILLEPLRAFDLLPDVGARDATLRRMLHMVGLPETARHRYPHELSGGQRQRVGIARAIGLRPEVVVLDEPVSALDVSIQAQIINLLRELQAELQLTYIFISHDLSVVRYISDRIGVMYLGQIIEEADTLYTNPRHPYTMALTSAVPHLSSPSDLDKKGGRIILTGDLPSPTHPPSGCRFHTRCPYSVPGHCDVEQPVLMTSPDRSKVACHYAGTFADMKRISRTNRPV